MNNLNCTIKSAFACEFEWRCMYLLVEAYSFAKSKCQIDIGYEEENISAVLFDYIDNCLQAAEWDIHIADEYRRYNKSILRGEKVAKSAPRIDFRFGVWEQGRKLTYFIEAKNLIETDSIKKGRKTKISAKELQQRYVETGIDNYVSGHYPSNGCLVGYILQGKIENIINLINQYLHNHHRGMEVLIQQQFNLQDFNSSYISRHKDKRTIKHLMFDFVSENI